MKHARIALVGWWLIVAAVFFGLGRLGLSLAFAQKNVTPFWPPSGFSLAVLLLLGPRLWPGVLAGGFALTLSTGVSWHTALLVGTGNMLEAVAGFVILRTASFHRTLDRLRDVARLIAVAAVSPLVGACVGAGSLYVTGVIPADALPPVWATWWIGDAIGILIVTPVVLSLRTPERGLRRGRLFEGALLLATTIAVGLVAFQAAMPIAYALFPLLIWAAARFRQHGAAGLSLVVAVEAIYFSALDHGPFAVNSHAYSLLHLQAFIGTGTTTALLLAAAVTERDRAAAERVRLAKLEGTREELEAGRRRFAFLAEVGRLLSTSLDVETTLENTARLCVPELAARARAELVERGLRRWSSHDDEGKQPPGGVAVSPAALTAVGENRIVATASPESDEEVYFTTARCLYVPLVSEGLTAVLKLEQDQPGRYRIAERDLIEELRRRALFALDNAQLYREAKQAIQLRNEFLSVAAHELKTPVTGLRGFAQLALRALAKPQPNPELLRQALGSIDQQSQKLTALVMQLLDVARIDAGKLRLSRKATDVAALLQGVVAQFGAHEESRRFWLRAAAPVEAEIDPLRVEQVVVNLLSNASRFAPDGTLVETELTQVDGHVRIGVTDRGPGVDAAVRDRIFERFYQGADGVATGMGLGLFISREIAELHGGRLTYEPAEGGGSRFVVELPITGDGRA